MAVSRTGDWARARRLLTAAPQRLQAAIGTAVRQEAHALRNEIVQGLTSQAPGGETLKPPSPLTIAAREGEPLVMQIGEQQFVMGEGWPAAEPDL